MWTTVAQEWRTPIAAAAVLTTAAQFLAGSLVCRNYIRKGSTGEASGFPFVCGVLSCSLWLRYGLLKDDYSIILVNIFGVILQMSYVIIYQQFTIRKSTLAYQLFGMLVILGFVFGYTYYESDHELALRRTGFITCTVTLVFIAAPLTMLFHVIQVRSTEILPFPIIFMSLIVSTLWFLYGVIVDDLFMVVPNGIGIILAAFQLFLFVIYPSKSSVKYNKLNQIM